jgi:hypothetical protein
MLHSIGLSHNILVANPDERDYLEDLGVDGKILKWISEK